MSEKFFSKKRTLIKGAFNGTPFIIIGKHKQRLQQAETS